MVGWSPVPNAMPGSSARTTSSGWRRWRRQVGRMTIRRPIRSTGKCAFQAFAQSASRTMAAARSPIGRMPKAWRWPSSRSARATAARIAAASRIGRWARTIAGRAKSTRAASPSSTSSKAGSTLVPPGAARDRISDTASTASWSAATDSSSQVPGVAAAAARSMPVERIGGRGVGRIGRGGRIGGLGTRGRIGDPRQDRAGARSRERRPSEAQLLAQPAARRHALARVLRVRLQQLALVLR